jgi:signal transduction histidine kinase
MLSHIDSTYLCQLTAAQIQEILVLNGVLIQQYQSQLHRWVTIAQLPDLGQLTLSLEPEKAADIDRRLHQSEIVEFTAMTTVMNLNICDRYVFIPLLEQCNLPDTDRRGNGQHQQSGLWGRICLMGNLHSIWTAQDLSWVQALGQQLLTAMNLIAGFGSVAAISISPKSSPLTDLAELIEKITDLESRCQQKDHFINNISHDLRAPLMNIKMAMRMLKTSLTTDPNIAELLVGHRAAKYLEILEQECDREVKLIDNILDLQRLEYTLDARAATHAPNAASPPGHQLKLELLEIATWLPSTIEPFNYRAQTDRQKLITSVSQLVPTITTDRAYLTKIFTELLNNACKYTREDGEIIVAVDAPNREWLTLVVKNQAEISDRHLPHIFEQFYRVPSGARSEQGGSGLGLALVQKLVTQLNGQIHVTSNAGWTEFAVKLPVGDWN